MLAGPPGGLSPPMPPTAVAPEHKERFGQYFTRSAKVANVMSALVTHTHGKALEPSAGAGHLVSALSHARPQLTIDAIEIDPGLAWAPDLDPRTQLRLTRGDFFEATAGLGGSYDVIFGNPPYVAWKDADPQVHRTAASVKEGYSSKANLFHLFIHRCAELLAPGGELIFIVPKEWLFSTSAGPLRRHLSTVGTLTHVIDCGEEVLFDDAAPPSLCIFRFVKHASTNTAPAPADDTAITTPLLWAESFSDAEHHSWKPRVLRALPSGRWFALPDAVADATQGWEPLSDQFSVKVGLVTGADQVFKVEDPARFEPETLNQQVTSRRRLEWFIDVNSYENFSDIPSHTRSYLEEHKDRLLARRIARFDETNWWRYGAVRNVVAMRSSTPRVFASAKSRSDNPFFAVDGAQYFTGAVLGLFQTETAVLSCSELLKVANSTLFRQLADAAFLTTGNKVTFQPATLSDMLVPATRSQYETFSAQ